MNSYCLSRVRMAIPFMQRALARPFDDSQIPLLWFQMLRKLFIHAQFRDGVGPGI